jgi:hypothetical protein
MSDRLPDNYYTPIRERGMALGNYLAHIYPPEDMDGMMVIPDHAVPILCDAIMIVVAEVIQCYIDAGSERESTMENEELFAALEGEFGGYGGKHQEQP